MPSPPEFGPEVMSVNRMTGPETICVVPFAFGRKSVKVRAIARHEKYLKEAINGVLILEMMKGVF